MTRANELRLFTVGPDGVPSMDAQGAAALLQDSGIPADALSGLTLEDLEQYVGEGRGVLLAVDSGELWYEEAEGVDEAADHALVLTGFDHDAGVAILSDPGSPTGDQYEVPISELEAMWADSGNTAVVCDVPPGEMPAEEAAEPEPTTSGDEIVPAADLDLDPVLPDLGHPTDRPPLDPTERNNAVVDWVLQHPYVLLPVVFGVAAVARRSK